jgi:formylglycine-generating enzyme required for sulfatase activity
LPKTLELDLGVGIKMNLVRIERGKFLMGSPPSEAGRRADRRQTASAGDEVQREVEIKAGYAMGIYLVTQSQYRQIMGTNLSRFSHSGAGKDKGVTGLQGRKLFAGTIGGPTKEQVSLERAPTAYAP